MGLKTVLFGLVYYKHVAPMELNVLAQLCFCDGASFIQTRAVHAGLGYKLLITDLISIVLRMAGSYIPSRHFPVHLCVSCSLSTTLPESYDGWFVYQGQTSRCGTAGGVGRARFMARRFGIISTRWSATSES